jgi:hypothetical protein
MSCGDRLETICGGKKTSAVCVKFTDIVPPIGSSLYGEGCLDAEETTKDLYELVGKLLSATDTTGLSGFCLEIDTNDAGEITQREINIAILRKLCETSTPDTTQPDVDPSKILISSCDLNYGDLVDACGDDINSLCALLQVLLDQANKVTTLETRVTALEQKVTNLEQLIGDCCS